MKSILQFQGSEFMKGKFSQIIYCSENETLFIRYSHLFNKRGAWNKRGGGAKVTKSLNVELGINVEGGIFGKS
jgi:hypothetical protein